MIQKNIPINVSSSGDTTLIAAPGDGRRIAVSHVHAQAAAAMNVTLKSGSTAITGPMPQAAGGGWVTPPPTHTAQYWYICNNNEALVINLSAAVQLGGILWYDVI